MSSFIATAAFAWPTNADDATLRSYGFFGDGSAHPLSSITTYNGQNSSGWTLLQWQAVLPAAKATSDAIDGVVINSLIQMAPGPITFHFAPGQISFSSPLATCNQSVAFFGSGTKATILNFGNSEGWEHCNNMSDPSQSVVLEAHDMTFNNNVNLAGTYGFNAAYTNTVYKTIRFTNVNFASFNSCILVSQSKLSIFDTVTCSSNRTPGDSSLGNGIELRGHDVFGTKIINSFMQNYTEGYKFLTTLASSGVGIEGVEITNSEAGKVKTCINITSNSTISPNYTPFQYSIDKFYCDSSSLFVNVDVGLYIQITGGNWLYNGPYGSWNGTGQDMFRFCRVNRVLFSDNNVSPDAQGGTSNVADVNSLIHVMGPGQTCTSGGATSASTDVQIHNNHIDYNSTYLTYNKLIINDPNTSGVLIKDNNFQNGFIVQKLPPAGSIVWGNPSASSSSIDAASALYLGNIGDIVSISSTNAAATSAIEVVAGTATLPQGVWNCAGSINYTPGGGAVITNTRGIQTQNGTIGALRNGVEVSYQDWNANINYAASRAMRPVLFDFSNAAGNSTVYFMSYSIFSSGTLTLGASGQCMRVR